MTRFFRRIFISVWVIIFLTGAVTMLAARLLPYSTDIKQEYDVELVEVVARDLGKALADNEVSAIDLVPDHHALDFDQLMQIYILTPDGREANGRELPGAVRALLPSSPPEKESVYLFEPRLYVFSEGLAGYMVVGYQTGFPFGRVLVKPGARLILALTALAISIGVSLLLTRFIVLPVRRLRSAGQQVAEGDLSVRVAHTVGARTDDIANLARDFDKMTERIETLLQSQQRLMRDVSHELRSPLARLQAMLSLARQNGEGPTSSLIDRLDLEASRLNTLIEEILEFSRLQSREALDRRPTDLVDLLRTIADDAEVEGEPEGKTVHVEGPDQCLLSLDYALMHSAFENIIRNSLRYTAPKTFVLVRVHSQAHVTTIEICDSGPGVPQESLTHLFEPFYRVELSRNRSSGGSGVGLAIAERSVRLHGGTISASNQNAGGLSIIVQLPAVS
jgi:two-component system sensor histidine kinase CpxA